MEHDTLVNVVQRLELLRAYHAENASAEHRATLANVQLKRTQVRLTRTSEQLAAANVWLAETRRELEALQSETQKEVEHRAVAEKRVVYEMGMRQEAERGEKAAECRCRAAVRRAGVAEARLAELEQRVAVLNAESRHGPLHQVKVRIGRLIHQADELRHRDADAGAARLRSILASMCKHEDEVERIGARLSALANESHEMNSCAICLDTLLSVDLVVRLPCQHVLHAGCAEHRIRSKQLTRCPVCRSEIVAYAVGTVNKVHRTLPLLPVLKAIAPYARAIGVIALFFKL